MDDFKRLIERAKKQLDWDSLSGYQRTVTLLHPHKCAAQLESGQVCPCDCLCLNRDQLKGCEPLPVMATREIKSESDSSTLEIISLQMKSSEPLPSTSWLSDTSSVPPERSARQNDASMAANVTKMKQQKCLKCHHWAGK